jgi:hypothetical protein
MEKTRNAGFKHDIEENVFFLNFIVILLSIIMDVQPSWPEEINAFTT